MALSNHWWILCAVSFCCVAQFGSCGDRQEGAQPELCAQLADTGPCKGYNVRHFFNKDTGRCERFIYGGCGGNKNNFQNLLACKETCLISHDRCTLEAAVGICKARLRRYYFSPEQGRCRRFIYGGCGGNRNNFKTLSACKQTCLD